MTLLWYSWSRLMLTIGFMEILGPAHVWIFLFHGLIHSSWLLIELVKCINQQFYIFHTIDSQCFTNRVYFHLECCIVTDLVWSALLMSFVINQELRLHNEKMKHILDLLDWNARLFSFISMLLSCHHRLVIYKLWLRYSMFRGVNSWCIDASLSRRSKLRGSCSCFS